MKSDRLNINGKNSSNRGYRVQFDVPSERYSYFGKIEENRAVFVSGNFHVHVIPKRLLMQVHYFEIPMQN